MVTPDILDEEALVKEANSRLVSLVVKLRNKASGDLFEDEAWQAALQVETLVQGDKQFYPELH